MNQNVETGLAPTSPLFTWHLIALALISAITLFSRFFHASFYGLFEDDFYYYAQVARNLILHHRSTFDGTHLTNGYHPLWLLTLVFLYQIFPGISFFIAAQAVGFFAILALYLGLIRCLFFLSVPARFVRLTALLLSLHALLLFRFGMEVTLALPLSIWMLATLLNPRFAWTTRQTLLFGSLACLTILARLDSAFLVATLLVAQLFSVRGRQSPSVARLAFFTLCFLPLFAYLTLNVVVFHTLLPVSGAAKQLKPMWPPSFITLRSLVLPFDRNRAAFVYPALILIGAGLMLFLRPSRPLPRRIRPTLIALFLFPLLHLATLSLLSDWTVWPWYFYSLTYPVLASTAIILTRPSFTETNPTRIRSLSAALVLLASCYTIYLLAYAAFKKPSLTSDFALFVARYAAQHPGTYAMGDDSGLSAFKSGQPFIQLEGLMMDRQYLDVLRDRTPLPQVLRQYHADYYVTLGVERDADGCFGAHEPQQAGPYSPRLPGRICAQPLAQMFETPYSVGVFRASDVLAP